MAKRPVQHGSPRVYTAPPPGIPKHSRAPYWQGERAEDIVQTRKARYGTERAARPPRGTRGPVKVRTPSQQLTRLERALKKRKTLAAQQRIQAQITVLRRDLGLPERREDRS